MEETPKELDWVNELANCELKTAFQKLSEMVEYDVQLYNARFDLQNPDAAVFQKRDDFPHFSVYRRTPFGMLSVTFRQKTDQIEIGNEAGPLTLSAIPVLTANGRCKFQVGDEQLEQWQLRRKALEDIFFKQILR